MTEKHRLDQKAKCTTIIHTVQLIFRGKPLPAHMYVVVMFIYLIM